MDADLPTSGTYVVAVSGGVDSVSLLHYLMQANRAARPSTLHHPPSTLVVAHFDHGIRPDSAEDRQLVQQLAKKYELPFIYDEGRLGPAASEATARAARYDFLERARRNHTAQAIITAHHQDDVLETAIINLLRGTGRKGLTALSNRPDRLRPFLRTPKQQIVDYAREQGLNWHEDSTNQDQNYLRNYVRRQLLPRFDQTSRDRLWQIIVELRTTNQKLDDLLVAELRRQAAPGRLDRQYFNQLPHSVAKEIMAAWLRTYELRDFDSRTLERLVIAAKTAAPGRHYDAGQGNVLVVDDQNLALEAPER